MNRFCRRIGNPSLTSMAFFNQSGGHGNEDLEKADLCGMKTSGAQSKAARRAEK
jgi:hypothetical protein